jgi:LEA14-like dessication related protein
MIFLSLTLGLAACATAPVATGPAEGVVTIEYDRLDFLAQALGGSTYGFKFLVQNGTSQSLSFNKVTWRFEFNGKEAGEETTAIALDVPGFKSGTFEVQVKVEYPKDPKDYVPFIKKRSVQYRLTGTVTGSGESYPIKAEYDVGLPELPTVKVPGAAIASGDKGEVGFSFDIFVKNPNVFPMKVDYVSYNLEIEGVPVGSGRIAEMEKVPSNSDLAYTFPAKMDLKEHGVKIKEMLGKKSMDFVITGVLSVEGIELPVQESGVIKFTR